MATPAEVAGAATGRLVLSWVQAGPLLAARNASATTVETSLDLGVSRTRVSLDADGVTVADAPPIAWERIEAVADDASGCWELSGAGAERIQQMSAHSGRLASLYPTSGPPALLLSGTLMHRIKGVDPGQDTRHKLRPLGRLRGQRLLDTATGLGYTAIAAAAQGADVTTVEWDPAVVGVARSNPWSSALFADDEAWSSALFADDEAWSSALFADDEAHGALQRLEGDIAAVVETFADGAFHRILHDPPVFELAGDLYGGAFYRQLHRVLAPRGRLFHYVGNLDSPSGARVARGAARRLEEAGFTRVERVTAAFGLSARA